MKFEIRLAPEGGWQEPTCSFESHSWTLEIEDGRAYVICANPCDRNVFRPGGPQPVCLVGWQSEDFHTPEPIPIALTYIDDSSPSTPYGPAEHSYYIEVRPHQPVNLIANPSFESYDLD